MTEPSNPLLYKCHEQRHMPKHVFPTYNAIRGFAEHYKKQNGGRLLYSASHARLADSVSCDTSEEAEGRSVKWLEAAGWIKRTHEGQRRWPSGNVRPNEYEVLTHAQFLAEHPNSCPAWTYKAEEEGEETVQRNITGLQKTNRLRAICARLGIRFTPFRKCKHPGCEVMVNPKAVPDGLCLAHKTK